MFVGQRFSLPLTTTSHWVPPEPPHHLLLLLILTTRAPSEVDDDVRRDLHKITVVVRERVKEEEKRTPT